MGNISEILPVEKVEMYKGKNKGKNDIKVAHFYQRVAKTDLRLFALHVNAALAFDLK